MPQADDPGAPPPLRVRYYPRRVGRGAAATPLSPAQALHLADDPQRAERARRTAQPLHLEVAAPRARLCAPAADQALPAGRTAMPVPVAVPRSPGVLRRWIVRLTRRG